MSNWQRGAALSLCCYCLISVIAAAFTIGENGDSCYLIRLVLRLTAIILIIVGFMNNQAWARWCGLAVISAILVLQFSGLAMGTVSGPYQQLLLGCLNWSSVAIIGLFIATLMTIPFIILDMKHRAEPLASVRTSN